MKLQTSTIILSNMPLKIISGILGFAFWYIFSQGQTISIWLDVPICFHDVPEYITIHCPETITINIAGKRTDLYALDCKHLAVHLNSQHLSPGKKLLTITSHSLFLPETINLLHYKPSNVLIEITEQLPEHTSNNTR